MDSNQKDTGIIAVGKRLRIMREERGISMRALARSSGLSANALSMIERGLTSPSVSTLHKLAGALQVPITSFFRTQPERKDVVFLKANQRNVINIENGLWEGLGGESFSGHLDSYLLTLDDSGCSGSHGMIHSGQEFVYCIQGTLQYEVDGEEFILDQGDSLIFSAHLSHRWCNVGEKHTQAVIVIAGFEKDERPTEYHLASDLSNTDD